MITYLNQRPTVYKVNLSGATDIQIRRKRHQPTNQPNFSGMYRYTETSRRKIYRILLFLEFLRKVKKWKAYLVTMTFPDSLSPTERLKRRSLFSDLMRKRGFLFVYITERQKSVNETTGEIYPEPRLHFHFLVIGQKGLLNTQGKKETLDLGLLRKWSMKYCGSVNGLDITRVKRTVFYLAKYLTKEEQSTNLQLSNWKLWSASKTIPRVVYEDYPTVDGEMKFFEENEVYAPIWGEYYRVKVNYEKFYQELMKRYT